MKKYEAIQNEVIKKYRINICPRETCTCWRRTHAHVKTRTVCKWDQKNTVKSTFDLLHEIGHIETTKSNMRRCESEYYATQWASDRCREYGIEVPESIRERYQEYIDREQERGERRGGHFDRRYQVLWGDERKPQPVRIRI